jgi:hypothetical protein
MGTSVKWALLTDAASEEVDISTNSNGEGPEGASVFGAQSVKMKPDLLTGKAGQYGVCCFHCLTLESFPSSKPF